MSNCSFMSISKRACAAIVLLPCLLGGCANASSTTADGDIAARQQCKSANVYEILVAKKADEIDVKWSDYLAKCMRQRSIDGNRVVETSDESAHCADAMRITVDVDAKYPDEYAIIEKNGNVQLIARSERTMQWLVCQLLKNISIADKSILADDLPPAIIEVKAGAKRSGNFAFEYREAYLPENIEPEQSAIHGENNVGSDWGLWGHNLYRIIGEDPDTAVYALVGGNRYGGQYCFSSSVLHEAVSSYIADNFSKPSRFVVMPNDDDAVCQCSLCTKVGNSDRNATPAVAKLVRELAEAFPEHTFFMGAYGSTFAAPADKMPGNVGALVSAMGWQLSPVAGGRRRADFDAVVRNWQGVCSKIYVWDYINNFDDYFTPFPVLRIMQQRLRHYRSIGVGGVFLNGSGEEYSSFSGLHNFVLSALMIDPDTDVETLVHSYFMQYFPTAGKMLAEQYLLWEDAVAASKSRLNIYAPINQAMEYLGGAEFGVFYRNLCAATDYADGEERSHLLDLQTRLAYTMLEVARVLGCRDGGCIAPSGKVSADVRSWLDVFVAAAQDCISESGLKVADYVKCWNMSILGHSTTNLIAGKELKALTRLDAGYGDLSVLTDCVNGLPCGYHYGWLISSLDKRLEIEVPLDPRAQRLDVSFLKLPRHRISLPVKIEVLKDGKHIAAPLTADDAAEADVLREESRRLVYSFDIGNVAADGGSVVLRITRHKGSNSHLAIDEIRLK